MAVNAWDEPKETLTALTSKEKLKQRVLLEGSAVAEEYRCDGVPTTFWIAPDGTIIEMESGFVGPASLERHTKHLLKKSG